MATLVISFLFMLSYPLMADTLREVDTSEIQWVICEKSPVALFQKLEIKFVKPTQRDVYYTETSNLDLIKKGVFLRTRFSGKKMKTALKKTYHSASNIPWNYLDSAESKCEWDVYGENAHIGCTLYHRPEGFNDLVSKLQHDFLKTEINFDSSEDLKIWGPVTSQEWEIDDFVIEAIWGPKNFFLLELSVRVPRKEESQTKERINQWLASKNVDICADPRGQTPDLLKLLVLH